MKIVITGVNLVEGGPLKVFKDVIRAFVESGDIDIICLVHKKSLFFDLDSPRLQFFEYPEIKSSWLKRIRFEYFSSLALSRKIKPDIWLSMHDMSSRVDVPLQFVYCHNPSPFYKSTTKELRYDFKLFLFSFFYRWLYKLNIKSNRAVIVQQQWIGEFLVNNLRAKNYIVSRPITSSHNNEIVKSQFEGKSKLKFFYPALARTFKNFELILDAVNYLKQYHPIVYKKLEVNLTIDGQTNRYASSLVDKYEELNVVNFLGVLTYEDVVKNYKSCDVVLFPSKLETWGLPITEAKEFSKPIILADLPYAYETLGNYSSALFVNPDDYISLANIMIKIVDGSDVFQNATYEDDGSVVGSWDKLIDKIKNIYFCEK
tara:strand:- start:1174 stop:2289 length:1116 start_codon:yes stop_codon:yes gene_type:complete